MTGRSLLSCRRAGITPERLASFDRPIRSPPPHFSEQQLPQLTADLQAYRRTLAAVHSGADLAAAVDGVLGYDAGECKGEEECAAPCCVLLCMRLRCLCMHADRAALQLRQRAQHCGCCLPLPTAAVTCAAGKRVTVAPLEGVATPQLRRLLAALLSLVQGDEPRGSRPPSPGACFCAAASSRASRRRQALMHCRAAVRPARRRHHRQQHRQQAERHDGHGALPQAAGAGGAGAAVPGPCTARRPGGLPRQVRWLTVCGGAASSSAHALLALILLPLTQCCQC